MHANPNQCYFTYTFCAHRIKVAIAPMIQKDGVLTLGDMVWTTGNRVHLSKGRFDREGGAWNPAPDFLETFEQQQAWAFRSSKLAVLRDLKGDMQQIANTLFKEHWSKQMADDDNADRDPLKPRPKVRESMRGLTSPAKVGESQELKNAKARKRKEKKSYWQVFDQWVKDINKWRETNISGVDGEASGNSKPAKRTAWDKHREQLSELQCTIKKKDKEIKDLKELKSDSDLGPDDTVTQGFFDAMDTGWKKRYTEQVELVATGKRKLREQDEEHKLEITTCNTKLSKKDDELVHNAQIAAGAVQNAEMKGYIRGMKEAQGSGSQSRSRGGDSRSPDGGISIHDAFNSILSTTASPFNQ